MKSLEINGKEYDLHFGIDFIREMDKRYQITNSSGATFGMGLSSAVIYIQDKNPVVLADIILSATHTLKQIPRLADVEVWLESQEDLDKVFDDFLSALANAPLTKSKVKEMLTAVAEA